ncbi:MAG: DUF2997 domain-containing protein [Cyanobacteria bacterium]|nr:DUF2997 domain-containing protein [Cyanobacteria bacterium CG_2015-16_32_12]NCO79650.1 DUF2997 domain-containing protein [Cyanobacteria bacterium CG_2015-22_32_23]
MKKELEIMLEVDENGDFNIEVFNGDGKNCVEATKNLEDVLGVVNNRKFKPEYRQQNVKNVNRLRN